MRVKIKWMLTLALLCTISTFAQEKTISGTVTDDQNLPLPGVNIVVKGTTTGVQSNFDGNYNIRASIGQTLVFTYLGFKTVEFKVGAANTINVQLEVSAQDLEEVIVTGYSTTTKESSTSAIATVTSKNIELVPIATFEQILQGKAAGLNVSSGSGQPGTVASVTIRGANSINGNTQPLYILDGIQIDPASFASLNANDFASVSVLKDAQAKNIYGARAAAGVIVITTKKGTIGKSVLQFRTYSGVSTAPSLKVRNLTATEFLEVSRELGANGAGNLTDQDIADRVAALNGFDVEDALLRTGRTSSHELVLSGGNEKTTFFTSASFFEQEGTVIGSKLQRLTTRLNLNHKHSEKLEFGLNTSLGFTRTDAPPSNGGVNLANPFLGAFVGNPVTPVFNEDGSFNTGGGLAFAVPNILEDIAFGIRETEEFKLITTANISYKPFKNFSIDYRIGVDFEDDFIVNALNPNTFRGQTLPAIGDSGSQTETSVRDVNFTSTLSVNYTNTFAEKHYVSVSGYVEAIRRDFRSSTFTGFQLESGLFGFANAPTAGTVDNGFIPTIGGLRFINSIFSYFGSGSYSYDNRYGVDFGVRSDRSSRVAPENSDQVFYSVGVRWSIDNESFLEDVTWIDLLKLRASFGTSGNDESIGVNDAIQQLTNPLFLGTPTFTLAGLANPNIGWEIQEDFNVGLDFGFFKNKITGTFEYYNSTTTDLIIPFNVSAAFGDPSVNSNAGTLENEGTELTLNFNLIDTKDWRLSINANAAYNFGVITDLGGQVEEFQFGTSIARVGEQFGAQFVVEYAGVNPSNGEPLYFDLDGNVTNEFSASFAKTGFGSSQPLYVGGFGFDLGWKGFSLSSLFTFQAEVTRFNNTTFFLENPNFIAQGLNLSSSILRRFQNPGDITDIPAFFVDGSPVQRQFSSQDLEDASFLRLRNVTLAYTMPSTILEDLPFSGLRIYAQGVNLLTFTRFTGLDPEDSNNITSFEFPNATTYTFGLDITF